MRHLYLNHFPFQLVNEIIGGDYDNKNSEMVQCTFGFWELMVSGNIKKRVFIQFYNRFSKINLFEQFIFLE